MSQFDRVLVQMAVGESVLDARELEAALVDVAGEPGETVLRRRGVSEEALARLVRKRDQAWSDAAKRSHAQLERQALAAAACRRGISWASVADDLASAIAEASPEGDALVREREPRDLWCSCGLSWTAALLPAGEPLPDCPECEGTLHGGERPAVTAESPTVGFTPTGAVDPKAATQAPGSVGESSLGSEDKTVASGPGAPSSSSSSTVERKLPERIGTYEVLSVLGRGGMGAVLEAKDSTSGRRVALKTIHEGFADADNAEARFEREGKVLSLLAHPNIVRFLDRGKSDGVTWIAMELVEGRSLSDRLALGRLPVGEACRIGRSVAEGLAYAHALGLVHRDVKPGNVLLGKRGEVKLADFGLARRRDESLVLTRKGDVVGTPLYMAPEQLDGLPSTPGVDLFALGAVLFHAVAGEPPFTGSFVQMAYQRVQGKHARLRDKVKDVPAGLDALVERLLSRRPEDRPNAAEVARTLAKWEDEAPVASSLVESKVAVADPRAISSGAKFGPFTIESRLGAGGMGAVFRATKADGKTFALKIVPQGLDANGSKRFGREVRALAEVEHENVVRFLDAGESDGLNWIAMELIEGQSLEQLVAAKGPLPEAQLLEVGDAVAAGLEALHRKGIVHRDVKPQNIMVGPSGKVTLVDLGLAKFLAAHTAVTESGALVGTPHYMAPEQLTGKAVDARTDLYALGTSLYHAATGRRPFDGETMTAIAFQHVHSAARPVRKLNPKLTAPTARVVDRLMEKRADRRPASAAEARRLFALARAGKSPDVGRTLVARALGGAVAFLALATLALAGWSALTGRPGPLPDLVSTSTKAARQQADELSAAEPQRRTRDGYSLASKESAGKASADSDRALAKDSKLDGDAPARPAAGPAPGAAGGAAPEAASALPAPPPSAKNAPAPEAPRPAQARGLQRAADAENRAESKKKPAPSNALDEARKSSEPAPAPEAERHAKQDGFAAPQELEKLRSVAPVDSRTRGFLALGVRLEKDGRFTRLADGAPMALVPARTHRLGSPDAPRDTALAAFLVDVEELSVARWERFRAAKRANGDAAGHYLCLAQEPGTEGHHDAVAESSGDLPARGLSVWDAACYAAWAKARLPHADEWEAAARFPDGRRFPWGAAWEKARANASVDGAASGPASVTSAKALGALGLKNVAGNVAEWTLDLGPTGADAAIRGGSWASDDASALELWRSVPGPTVSDLSTVGFRLVVEVPAELAR